MHNSMFSYENTLFVKIPQKFTEEYNHDFWREFKDFTEKIRKFGFLSI